MAKPESSSSFPHRRTMDAIILVGPYLSYKDIARCNLVCHSWSKLLKPLLWWDALENLHSTLSKRAKQLQLLPTEYEAERGLLLDRILNYFRLYFETKIPSALSDICVKINSKHQWIADFLAASGCDSLRYLTIGHNYPSKDTDLQIVNDITNTIIHRNKNLQYLGLILPTFITYKYIWKTTLPSQSMIQSKLEPTAMDKPIYLSSSLRSIALKDSIIDINSTLNILCCLSSVIESFEFYGVRLSYNYDEPGSTSPPPNLPTVKSNVKTLRLPRFEFYGIRPSYDYDEPGSTSPPPNLPTVKSNVKTLRLSRTAIPDWMLWVILGYTPELKSIYAIEIYIEPLPLVDETPIPSPYPVTPLHCDNITSISFNMCTMQRSQLRYLLAACPHLQQLHLAAISFVDPYYNPLPFFPFVATTGSSNSDSDPTIPTALSDQDDGRNVLPGAAYFKNLKHVVLDKLIGRFMSAYEQAQFLKSLPALEYVEFTINPDCAIFAMLPTYVDPPTEPLSIPDFKFENVKEFILSAKNLSERKMAKLFGLIPPQKCTTLNIHQDRFFQWLAVEGDGDGSALTWPEGLFLQNNNLERIHITGDDDKCLGLEDLIPGILQRCTHLKRLEATGRRALAMWCTVENLSVPWACSELEHLQIFMDCTHSNDPRETLYGIDMVTPAFQETQRLLFERIGSLKKLRRLAICRGGGDIPSVDFSLKTGLESLCGLKELEELGVELVECDESTVYLDQDVFYRICENMQVEDAVWMVEQWPKLRIVRGMTWFGREGPETLKRLLMERRSDVVFIEP
ncbi:hypothetical protein BGZ49_004828 [Haplosporangium sp. Z 27]|nr:hypothetical protein BGZ49_004828 [Haplosporangium sp. Z 27]